MKISFVCPIDTFIGAATLTLSTSLKILIIALLNQNFALCGKIAYHPLITIIFYDDGMRRLFESLILDGKRFQCDKIKQSK